MSSCSASGEAASSYGEGLCPRSDSLHLLPWLLGKQKTYFTTSCYFFTKQCCSWIRDLWLLLSSADTVTPNRVSLPCFLPLPRLLPCACPWTLVVGIGSFSCSSHQIYTPCPCLCSLCPAKSVDSTYPSRLWSNPTSFLNPRSLAWVSGAPSSSPYPK